MVAGVVFFRTREKNMYKLGGLYRKMPFAATVGLIAALGITGMPLFNGFASKSILHHAIIEAYEYGHPAYRWAEYLFTFVSACTAASFIKLYSHVFLGPMPEKFKYVKEKYNIGTIGMVVLALLVVFIGVFPHFIMNYAIIPSARAMEFDPYFIDKYLMSMNFFNSKDLGSMLLVYTSGFIIYIAGVRFNLFHFHLPKQLDPESDFYQPLYMKFGEQIRSIFKKLEQIINVSDVFIYGVMLLLLIILLISFL